MSNEIIQADYNELNEVAKRFTWLADVATEMRQRIEIRLKDLVDGGWIGTGSEAFFEEMDAVVLPAVKRMIVAFEEAGEVTRQITVIMQDSEANAASQFTVGADGEMAVTNPMEPISSSQSFSESSNVAQSAPPPVASAKPDFSRMSQQEFIDTLGPLAAAAQAQTQVPASVTIAQAILETGWGKSTIGDANNLFGIKGVGPAGSVTASTWEVINGEEVTVDAQFRAYHSFEESVADHAQFFIENELYATAMQYTDNPDEFARQIAKAGYATDPAYADKLISLMRSYNLYRFDQ